MMQCLPFRKLSLKMSICYELHSNALRLICNGSHSVVHIICGCELLNHCSQMILITYYISERSLSIIPSFDQLSLISWFSSARVRHVFSSVFTTSRTSSSLSGKNTIIWLIRPKNSSRFSSFFKIGCTARVKRPTTRKYSSSRPCASVSATSLRSAGALVLISSEARLEVRMKTASLQKTTPFYITEH